MATGVTKQEQLSEDALTAVLPHRDPHPLPGGKAVPMLQYPGRLDEAEVLKLPRAEFRVVEGEGQLGLPMVPGPSSLLLTDNLFGLHALRAANAKVTLFYLDPPYNTGLDFQSRQLEHAYGDKWGLADYVEFMRRRFILMRDLLTDEGSIYVHIDHRMLGHLKVVMDEIFGVANFRNIITRRKCSSKNFTKHQYSNIHDYILFYTKSDAYKWNQPGEAPEADWVDREYPKHDAKGRYKLVPIHAPGTRNGETGREWRDMMPPPGKHWQYTPARLDEFDRLGEIYWSRNGNPRRKVYFTDNKILPLTDYWAQFRDAHHQSIAVTGYPTEKNLQMLKTIVAASSDPGDLVVDPFCGSGTTLQAAAELGRDWIGMDQSFIALKATITRLRYGSEPMGDFVNRENPPAAQADLSLFPEMEVETSEVRASDPIPFQLLADEELFAHQPAALSELASL